MADDPRIVAVIDAENRAKQVLLSAASDVAKYESSVKNASRGMVRDTARLQRANETAYRKIIRFTADATEIIEEQVTTVADELIPTYHAYNDVIDATMLTEDDLSRSMNQTNRVMTDRKSLLEALSHATLTGAVTAEGIGTAAGEEKGNLAGAAVTTVTGIEVANRAVPASKKALEEYTKTLTKTTDKTLASKDAMKAFGTEFTRSRRILDGTRTVLGRIGSSFMSFASIVGRVFLWVAVAIVAIKGFTKALEVISSLFDSQRSKYDAAIQKQKAYNLAIAQGKSELEASLIAQQAYQAEMSESAKTTTRFSGLLFAMSRAFRPWVEAWDDFKKKFLMELAPTIAVISSILLVLGATVAFVANKVILPILQMAGNSIIFFLRIFNETLLLMVDVLIDILQPIVDSIVLFINQIRVAWGIITSENHTVAQKFVLFFKLLLNIFTGGIKSIVTVAFGIVIGLSRVFTFAANVVLLIITNGVRLWKKAFKTFVLPVIDMFLALFAKLGEIVVSGLNFIIDNFNKLLPEDWEIPKLEMTNFMKSKDALVSAIDDAIGSTHMITSIDKLIAEGLGIDPESVATNLENVKNLTIALIEGLEERFGIDLSSIADEVGVDLIESPDLRAGFKKVLDKTKLKLELAGLGELNENLSKVNAKDLRIEINPLIQFHITENVDAEAFRAMALPIIDQAFLDGATKAGQQIYSVNVGNV